MVMVWLPCGIGVVLVWYWCGNGVVNIICQVMSFKSSKRSNSDQSKSVEHLESVHRSDFHNALIISQNQPFFKRMPSQLFGRFFQKFFYHVIE